MNARQQKQTRDVNPLHRIDERLSRRDESWYAARLQLLRKALFGDLDKPDEPEGSDGVRSQ
jgi:hypothetical protein